MKRTWISRAAALALCLMLLLAGCAAPAESTDDPTPAPTESAETPAEEGGLPAGTYTGSATGFHGPIEVEVTLDETSIVSVEVTSHTETENVGTVAIERLPEEIVSTQSLALDAVAGCTFTSDALLEAVTNALESAGVDTDLFMTAPEEEAPQGEVEKTADVVVVGGGGAGLAAALSAAENGASVIVLEKTGMLGGTTILGGAYYATGNQEISAKAEMNDKMREDVANILALEPENDDMARWQDTVREQYDAYLASGETYMFDSEEYHMLQVYADGGFLGDTALIERLCSISRECYDWLASYGLPWSDEIIGGKASDTTAVVLDAQRARRNKSNGEESHSAMLIHVMQKGLEDSGVEHEILLETAGTELIVENGAVTGVIATGSDGTTYRVHANKGVILATGGFSANAEMCQEYNTLYPAIPATAKTTNSSAATGDGIKMAEGAGAALIDMELIQLWPHLNPFTGSTDTYICAKNNLMVNPEGVRFVNESGSETEVTSGMFEQTDGLAYLISDANNTTLDAEGKNSAGLSIDDMIADGTVVKADTLEDLAAQLNMDPEVLKSTVDAFNAACDSGEDAEFGRTDLTAAMKITTAPFYATATSGGLHHTMGGVHIDTNARALDENGEVIPGLYAAGEVAGGFHGNNRVSGNAILEAIGEGKIAGADAASR